MSGCVRLNARFGCDHVKEYSRYRCDEHKESDDWSLCPRLETKTAYVFDHPCDYCRAKVKEIRIDEFHSLASSIAKALGLLHRERRKHRYVNTTISLLPGSMMT